MIQAEYNKWKDFCDETVFCENAGLRQRLYLLRLSGRGAVSYTHQMCIRDRDLADRILPSVLDQEGAAIVQKHLEQKNISCILSDSVQSFEQNEATLASGKKVPFDVLVVAVGVRPNTNLVSDAGGKVNRGIVIDEKCKTSLCDIYAAGDCVESHDITINENRILALLPNAYIQGETAGINMAGGEKTYDSAIPMNAVGFFGLHVITAGSYGGEETIISDGSQYKKLIVKDGLLKGYIMVGDVCRAGIYTSLIRNQRCV